MLRPRLQVQDSERGNKHSFDQEGNAGRPKYSVYWGTDIKSLCVCSELHLSLGRFDVRHWYAHFVSIWMFVLYSSVLDIQISSSKVLLEDDKIQLRAPYKHCQVHQNRFDLPLLVWRTNAHQY